MAAKKGRKNTPWDVLVESAKSQREKKWIAGNQCNWNHLKMKGMNTMNVNEKKIVSIIGSMGTNTAYVSGLQI